MDDYYISFGILCFILAAYLAYLFVSFFVLKRTMTRVADLDHAAFHRAKDKDAMRQSIMAHVDSFSQWTSQIAPLSVAVIILGLQLLGTFPADTLEHTINLAVIGGVAIAAMIYLVVTEQYATAGSPGITDEERFDLYKEANATKVIGFFMLWGSILLALSLTKSAAIVAVASIGTLIMIIRDHEKRWTLGPGR